MLNIEMFYTSPTSKWDCFYSYWINIVNEKIKVFKI